MSMSVCDIRLRLALVHDGRTHRWRCNCLATGCALVVTTATQCCTVTHKRCSGLQAVTKLASLHMITVHMHNISEVYVFVHENQA
jgi:hypothetical protein